MPNQPWVCSACRSVNQPRENRCYRCRTPRELVEADPETLLVAGAGSVPSPVAKSVGTFRSSGDLAFLTQVLIVAALGVAVVGSIGSAVYFNEISTRIPAGVPSAASAETVEGGIAGAAAAAERLPAALSAELFGRAGEAFTNGLNVAAGVCAAAMWAERPFARTRGTDTRNRPATEPSPRPAQDATPAEVLETVGRRASDAGATKPADDDARSFRPLAR